MSEVTPRPHCFWRSISLVLPALFPFCLAACAPQTTPVEVLEAAQKAARSDRMEEFSQYLSEASRAAFWMASSVGRRYGYLNSETFQFMAVLETGTPSFHDDVAELPVTVGRRTGAVCFVQEEGDWKLELLRQSPCLTEAEAPDYSTMPWTGPVGSAKSLLGVPGVDQPVNRGALP